MKEQLAQLKSISRSLEPGPKQRVLWTQAVMSHTEQFLISIPQRPAFHAAADEGKGILLLPLTEEPQEVLPDGAYAVKEVRAKPPMEMIGQVTSSYLSPTLGRSIAMALIQNGRARMGEVLSFPLETKVVRARIVEPVFYDREGGKLNA